MGMPTRVGAADDGDRPQMQYTDGDELDAYYNDWAGDHARLAPQQAARMDTLSRSRPMKRGYVGSGDDRNTAAAAYYQDDARAASEERARGYRGL